MTTQSSNPAEEEETTTHTTECTDQPEYADCKLIVEANFCHNEHFAKFCCKSCSAALKIRK